MYKGASVEQTTYNLVGLSASDFKGLPNDTTFSGSTSVKLDVGTIYALEKVGIYNAVAQKIVIEMSGGKSKDIQLTTGSYGNNTMPSATGTKSLATAAINDLKEYLFIPVAGAAKVTVTAKKGNSNSASSKCIAALYDADGKRLDSTAEWTVTESDEITITGTTTGATTVYLTFFRSTSSGSLRVTKIEIAPPDK